MRKVSMTLMMVIILLSLIAPANIVGAHTSEGAGPWDKTSGHIDVGATLIEDTKQSMDLYVMYDEGADFARLTWYPTLANEIERFDIVCFGENDDSQVITSVSGEERSYIVNDVTSSGFTEVEVRAFDKDGVLIEVTPREPLFTRLTDEGMIGPESTSSQLIAQGTNGFEVYLVSCDSQNFPFIYLTVRVSEGGQPVGDLTKDNFSLTEDGRLQTDMFDVVPPEFGGGVRMADIIFLIDNSGSMSEEIAAVKNNCETFADALAASAIDYRLGLVQFGQSANSGHPRIIGSGLTADATEFKSWVATMPADGGYEYGFEAIRLAIQSYSFRPGAQKVFIIITDEDSDDRDKQATIDLIQANDVTVHAAVDCSYGTSESDYCGSGSVREGSGGLLFPVTGDYTTILDTISEEVANTYIVRYRTDNPILDGIERLVVCTVEEGTSSGSVQCTYIPGGAPQIQRTQETLALHSQSFVAGSSPTISVIVTDSAEPFVQSVTLCVRITGSDSDYAQSNMLLQGSDIYSAQVPGDYVQTPGLDYYIRATDGQVTSSDPSSEPDKEPYQIAVLPNEAPEIQHTPPDSWQTGSDVQLEIGAIDNTYGIKILLVKYREPGELIWQLSTITYNPPYPTSISETITLTVAAWDAPAIEYYIEVTDDLGVSSLWPEGGADAPYVLEAATGDTTPPNTEITNGPSGTIDYNDVTFNWTGSDGITPTSQLLYSYILEPSDSDWSAWTDNKSKQYLDLPNGDYTFMVKAKDQAGNIDPTSAERAFTVARERKVWGIPPDFGFSTNLKKGNDSPEVRYLQIVLNSDPETRVAEDGDGSPGRETTTFGSLTESAVIKFQEKYADEILEPLGLSEGTGIVGQRTRTKLNTILAELFVGDVETFQLLNKKERKSAIWNYIKEFKSDYLPEDFPDELILAVATQETGEYAHWNNEHVANDWGRGIMQITTDSYVGAGGVDSESEDCIKSRNRESKIYSSIYYSNTVKGIKANIKDGLYALGDKYQQVNRDKIQAPEAYTEEEIIWMSTVQRYNGFRDIPSEYILYIGGKLVRLANGEYGDFDGFNEEYARLLGEKFKIAYNEKIRLYSPAKLCVYDSEGNVTGLVNEEVREEIPNSIYDNETRTVLIFFPSYDYYYNIIGVEEGAYGLNINFFEGGESVSFTATDIPIIAGVVHQYTVDWEALARGEEGVTIQIDSDGDGIFERTITADNELTVDEFWPYSFEDSLKGTKLRINTYNQTFQFIAPDKEFSIKKASKMRVIDLLKGSWVKYSWFNRCWSITPYGLGLDSEFENELLECKFKEMPKNLIIIHHYDKELWLSAVAVDGIDFCIVHAKDLETGKRYLLVDKPGVEPSVIITEEPEADFTASRTEGKAPLIVRFTDKSTGKITSWLWDFGDGKTSTRRNPTHVYWKPGAYTVTLTVNGLGGSDTFIISDCIKVEKANWWWRNSFTYPHFHH